MSCRKYTSLSLYIIAYALFVVGLILPVYEIRIRSADESCPALKDSQYTQAVSTALTNAIQNGELDVQVYQQVQKCTELPPIATKTIPQTIEDLINESNIFPAVLIITFTIGIPVLKGILCVLSLFCLNISDRLFKIIEFFTHSEISHISIILLSKWAMVDVFTISLFVAFLSLKNASIPIEFTLDNGFYCFASYCITSLVAVTVHPKINDDDDDEDSQRYNYS